MTNRTLRPLGSVLYAAILTGAALNAHADPQPAAPKPPAAAKPTQSTPDLSPQAKMAVKLAGLVAFVANSCPQLKPDYPRFKATIAALGVGTDQLDQGGMKTAYLGYTSQYQTDVKGNCDKAREQFGPGGKTVPDIFAVK